MQGQLSLALEGEIRMISSLLPMCGFTCEEGVKELLASKSFSARKSAIEVVRGHVTYPLANLIAQRKIAPHDTTIRIVAMNGALLFVRGRGISTEVIGREAVMATMAAAVLPPISS